MSYSGDNDGRLCPAYLNVTDGAYANAWHPYWPFAVMDGAREKRYIPRKLRACPEMLATEILKSVNYGDELMVLNGASLHAAFSPTEKLAFAVFFSPGRVEIPDAGVLELDQPTAALFRDGKWFFADPAQSLEFLTGRWNGRSFRVVLPKGDFTGQTCRAE